MSFHLEGPWLSTTGKKKGPKKWASAEAKRKAEFLEESWKALQKKWGIEAEEKKRKRASCCRYVETKRNYFEEKLLRLKACRLLQDLVYEHQIKYIPETKSKVLVLCTKANAVPVFSDEEAQDIAKMRR
jgi:hypothetical protein